MNRLQQDYCLGGRYLLDTRIASGGMGDVWAAHDGTLDRTVAVKVLRPLTDGEPVFARRFRDEALFTAGLRHPNIAQIYDYGEEDSLAYLVMELVPGEPLSTTVQREGAQSPEFVRSVMAQAALALGAAHEAGVVHRDVKPGNILVSPDGTVKLTDFGIARALDGSGHTRTGEVLGTPHYLSPEQAMGEAATGASDLYALGIVAHELLTGRRPFEKLTPVATALAQVNDPPPPLPAHVPPALRLLVEQCLAKAPSARPASARELGERLGSLDDVAVSGDAVPAVEVLGAAAEAEAIAVEAAEAPGGPAGTMFGPGPVHTPVPHRPAGAHRPAAATPIVRRVRGPRSTRVHWAWIPATGVLTVLATALVLAALR
ncbi:serine/threonine-protein kinase [Phycicoccus duodecadis]|uniref:non-specific serine/threonine protein kinase n=1 Tax=Phycicoccus duodecadis TaxID=173053 RepID=A0A2N3YIJ9_9MICO|nr:serine/threonine-protein kinase [Phycicoccus duodecadis]PKW26673.1 serine/threonine-protein kinase [Phycicoccus duodecadis]